MNTRIVLIGILNDNNDVFAYNDNAIKFYDKNGYHSRMYTNIKKIGD